MAYFGPPIAINDDVARAAAIVERILSRCPELTHADLLLVARVLTDRQRATVKTGFSSETRFPRPDPRQGSRAPKAILSDPLNQTG